MSTVEVIVPCYNYGRFLKECVESLLSQSHRDLRVLIINDASPDNTHEVAQELFRRDSRVQYLRHPVNRGHIATYNEGLERATGEYTLLLSADDMLTPGSLARSVQLMDAHPELVMTHGVGIVLNPDQAIPKLKDVDTWESTTTAGHDFIKATCELGANFVNGTTAIVRTDIQKRIGGYRADLPCTGDMEMWLRFGAHGSIGYIHAPQAIYRKHDSNMHYGYLGMKALLERRSGFSSLFDSYGHLFPNAGELRGMAMSRMAEEAFWSAYRAFEQQETALCKSFLEFATATDPRIKNFRAHRRMRLKLLLGAKLWSKIQKIRDFATARGADEGSGPTSLESSVGPRRGTA